MRKEIKAKRIGGNDILVMKKLNKATYAFYNRVMTQRGEILSEERIDDSTEVIAKCDRRSVFQSYYDWCKENYLESKNFRKLC